MQSYKCLYKFQFILMFFFQFRGIFYSFSNQRTEQIVLHFSKRNQFSFANLNIKRNTWTVSFSLEKWRQTVNKKVFLIVLGINGWFHSFQRVQIQTSVG